MGNSIGDHLSVPLMKHQNNHVHGLGTSIQWTAMLLFKGMRPLNAPKKLVTLILMGD